MMFWTLILCALLAPEPAQAAPIVAAIGAIGSAIAGAFGPIMATKLGAFLVKTVASMVFSKLAEALSRKSAPRPPGIQTDMTTSGGTTVQKFIVGRYATGGQLIAPPNSYGDPGHTPRAWLIYPIALSVVPGCTMERVIVDDEYMTWAGAAGPSWGVPATGNMAGFVWVDYEDGSQTSAHPDLIANFGTDPDRPWLSDMVGPGTCYAVLRFKYNRERFNSLPAVRFEMLGIPLYDPRADSSAGGSGPQRWSNRSTWTQTQNPVVIIYNILRGIDVGAGMIWGGECAAEDLPLANWFAAMNECDLPVTRVTGGTEPQFRAGLEIALSDEPADVIEELKKCCSGSMVEIGGVWKIRVGAPALPSYYITDDDVIVSRDQEFDEFPGIGATVNGITATYPDPQSLWESHEAPPRYNPAWEAADGGRRLVANLDLPACPYPAQVQRLMASLVADHRRFRAHKLALPPEAMELEPLETIGWTSARYGYAAKTFEITALTDSLTTIVQGLSLRERDAGDYDWSPSDELPSDPAKTGVTLPAPRTVPGFAVTADMILDGNGIGRRPAILISWDPAQAIDARGILWEARVAGTLGPKLSGSLNAIEAGQLRITDGLLAGTDYEVRACLILDRPVVWTAWTAVTTPGVYITDPDFGPGGVAEMFRAAGLSTPRLVAALPLAGPTRFVGELVLLTTDFKLYRWTGTAWTAAVPTTDLTGQVASSQLLIADLSNLCENPGFELGSAGWGAVSGGLGFSLPSTNARSGTRCAARIWAAGLAADASYRNNLVFDVVPGAAYRLSAHVKRDAGGLCASVGVRMSWLDAGKAEIAVSQTGLTQAETSTAYLPVSNIVTAPAGAVYGRVELAVTGHSAGSFYWDDVYCYRANGGELIVDGTIFGNHVAANTLTAGLLAAGAVKAHNMEIDESLTISAVDAGFAMGKSSATDMNSDGLYMGRAAKADGSTGFGFLMGRQNGAGIREYIQHTSDAGLRIINAKFGLLADVAAPEQWVTSNTTVVLPVGTKTLSLAIQGGGGGGGVTAGFVQTAPQAGGTTTVQLYDGASYTGVQWIAGGGAAGLNGNYPPTAGESSPLGSGGGAGSMVQEGNGDNVSYYAVSAGNGSGYGAGGGGGYQGGKGGKKGALVNVLNHDVSALANPRLVITVGGGGGRGVDPGAVGAYPQRSNGGFGSQGLVRINTSASQIIDAGPVPFRRTFQQNVSRPANYTGALVAGTFKPGIWMLDETSGNFLETNLQLDHLGSAVSLWSTSAAVVFAEKTPVVTFSSGNARTIRCLYFPLQV